MSKNAYVWLLMKGDKYMGGILTSAYSIQKTKTPFDLVVMVTKDVSQSCRNELKKILKVIEIEYLSYQTKMNLSEKQLAMYTSWAADAYTKWQCLALNYEKILFLDADILVHKNMDHLFDMETPAAIFNDLGQAQYPNTPKDKLGRLALGTEINPKDLHHNLYERGMVINASCVLLSPSKEDYKGYLDMMEPYKTAQYGLNCVSMYDEQSLTEFYKDKTWRVISKNYSLIPWHPEGYPWDEIYAYHYAYLPKIWLLDPKHPNQKFDDIKIWTRVQEECRKKYSIDFAQFSKLIDGKEIVREE